jgi:ribosomal-protein-alanine N-acetyltransferase
VTAPSWEIIPATPFDVADILRVEEACFSAPWTRKMVEAELSGNPFAHFLLAKEKAAEPDGASSTIVGYVCFWIVFEEVRLMNLAVIESMRRRGVARSLVATALHTGLTQSATRAVLEVRSSNVAAQTLYGGLGFQQVGVRPTYYSNPVEDAVLMELDPLVLDTSSLSVSSRHLQRPSESTRSPNHPGGATC